jgi:hypothetical protein
MLQFFLPAAAEIANCKRRRMDYIVGAPVAEFFMRN